LKKRGDEAVVQGLRRVASKRRIGESVEKEAVKILSADVYAGFGPTLAAETGTSHLAATETPPDQVTRTLRQQIM
jgi:hypothetical protein